MFAKKGETLVVALGELLNEKAVVRPSCLVGSYSRFGGTVLVFGSSTRFDHRLLDDILR